jgi:short-subunit dehydrogenase
MNLPLKILITGTNKGIGNELVKQFLKFNQNSTIYATSREEPEKAYERWRTLDKANQVKCKYLNISSTENIREFAKEMEQEKVKIDILINNAGVGKAEELHREFPNLEWTKECLGINVVSQVILTEQLLPLLSDNCKIANLSSMYGGLKFQPPQTQARFSNPNITK